MMSSSLTYPSIYPSTLLLCQAPHTEQGELLPSITTQALLAARTCPFLRQPASKMHRHQLAKETQETTVP